MQVFENKLKYDLFLGGLELNDEDKMTYEKYKSANIQKESNPNIHKWRILVERELSKK